VYSITVPEYQNKIKKCLFVKERQVFLQIFSIFCTLWWRHKVTMATIVFEHNFFIYFKFEINRIKKIKVIPGLVREISFFFLSLSDV